MDTKPHVEMIQRNQGVRILQVQPAALKGVPRMLLEMFLYAHLTIY